MDMLPTLDRRADARKTLFWTCPLGLALGAVEALAQQRQDVVGLRVAPEHRLREDELAVEVDVEDASRARNDLERLDHALPLREHPRHQTGGVRQRASGNAVLDPDAVSSGHGRIQSVPPLVPSRTVHDRQPHEPDSEQLSATCGYSVRATIDAVPSAGICWSSTEHGVSSAADDASQLKRQRAGQQAGRFGDRSVGPGTRGDHRLGAFFVPGRSRSGSAITSRKVSVERAS